MKLVNFNSSNDNNASTTKAGRIDVEIQQRGQSTEGYSFADGAPIQGDVLWTACQWKRTADMTRWLGKTMELALRMRSAKFFACRFS